jgi:signal transduction histidine kinase
MTAEAVHPKATLFEPGRIIVIALYLHFVATVGRTLAWFLGESPRPPQFPYVMGLDLAFILLYTLVLWRPGGPYWLLHLYFAIQSCLVLSILYLVHNLDFTTGFFLLLSYQAARIWRGKTRLAWIILLILMCVGHVLFFNDPLRNAALQLSTIAGIIVLPAYIVAMQEEEEARAQSQVMLAELKDSHQKLEVLASQAEDLAAMDERNQLARELHDSVSQTIFSILLNVRAAQLLQQRDPARLRPQLETLQDLAQSSLAEMRSLITQLRPK